LYEAGFKQHHVDGEALALHAHLRAASHASVLLDAYYRARQAPTLDDIIEWARRQPPVELPGR